MLDLPPNTSQTDLVGCSCVAGQLVLFASDICSSPWGHEGSKGREGITSASVPAKVGPGLRIRRSRQRSYFTSVRGSDSGNISISARQGRAWAQDQEIASEELLYLSSWQ